MLGTLTLAIIYLTLGPLAGLFLIPWSLLVGNIHLLYRVSMGIAKLGIRAAGVRVRVAGLENLPPGQPCIFMANHVSNLDPPVILPLIPGETSVLLKASLMRIPILGTAMRMGKFVPVERNSSRESAKRSIAAASDVIRSGLHFCVFPEGTRSRSGHLGSFKKGPFFLAVQTEAPIIPVAIAGTERLLRKGSAAICPGPVELTFLPPLHPNSFKTRDELMRAVHTALAAALPVELQPLPAENAPQSRH